MRTFFKAIGWLTMVLGGVGGAGILVSYWLATGDLIDSAGSIVPSAIFMLIVGLWAGASLLTLVNIEERLGARDKSGG
jgi:hypothetical protein